MQLRHVKATTLCREPSIARFFMKASAKGFGLYEGGSFKDGSSTVITRTLRNHLSNYYSIAFSWLSMALNLKL